MKQTLFYLLFFGLLLPGLLSAQRDFYQTYSFTEADSLRGMMRVERACYDVTFYDLNIAVDVENQSIEGHVDIFYTAMSDFERLQIDLFENMFIRKITFGIIKCCNSKSIRNSSVKTG